MTFILLLPLSNLFHCLCLVLLYSKTPKQVFFNPINIFDIFYTLYLLFYNLLYNYNITSNLIFKDFIAGSFKHIAIASACIMFCGGYLLVQSVVVICSYAIGGQRSHYDMLWWGCLVYFNILYWLFYLDITTRTTK